VSAVCCKPVSSCFERSVDDLSNFERGQTTGVHLAATSVTKTVIIRYIEMTVSNVISAYTILRKTTLAKRKETVAENQH
jgi:hypothetical protein